MPEIYRGFVFYSLRCFPVLAADEEDLTLDRNHDRLAQGLDPDHDPDNPSPQPAKTALGSDT